MNPGKNNPWDSRLGLAHASRAILQAILGARDVQGACRRPFHRLRGQRGLPVRTSVSSKQASGRLRRGTRRAHAVPSKKIGDSVVGTLRFCGTAG